MLRPFKSFLNNLQKNAIGATILGILPDMMNNSEEEEIPSSAIVYNQDDLLGEDDPLSDPLALDDNIDTADFGVNTDVDTSAEGEIILVDVDSLKSAFATNMPDVTKLDADKENLLIKDDKCKLVDNSNGDLNEQNKINVQNDTVLGTILSDSLLDIVDLTDIEVTNVENHGSTGDDSQLDIHFEPVNITLVDEVNEETEGTRSDGSDSGFGIELSSNIIPGKAVVPSTVTPARSNLKRRSSAYHEPDVIESKRQKRNIQFNGVTVYYFPRIQGFTCIPSQGGCTLGMGPHHFYEKSFTLSEHNAEQKRIHRQKMQELNPTRHLSAPIPPMSNSIEASSTDESDSEEEVISDNSSSDLDIETNGFLQPVSQRQRRAMLKASGVREIESYEKNECRDIRASREFCGCNCRGYCDPDTCFCSQSGIKCQVDRASFPCGCTQDGCGNVVGRIEFNPKRVRTHFIHTIMRLELEKKQKKADEHNTLNSYDGRVRLRENGLDTIDGTIPAVQRSNLQSNLNDMPTYNNQSMMFSTGSNSIASNGLDLTGGVCSSNFNSGILGNGCDPSMPESTLDLHYAFRNDYHVGTSPQSSPQISTQQNYLMYNTTPYFATSANSAFTDYVLGSSSHGHAMHAPSYPSFTQSPSSFMVPTLDNTVISDIIGVPATPQPIGTFNGNDSSYQSLQNSTSSLFGDQTIDDIHTPNRIVNDSNETRITAYTKLNRTPSATLNNNEKAKSIDYSNSLKTEAQRYDAINEFLESSRSSDQKSLIPYVALTPLTASEINNSCRFDLNIDKTTTNGVSAPIDHLSNSIIIDDDDDDDDVVVVDVDVKPSKDEDVEVIEEEITFTQSAQSTTSTTASTISNIINNENLCEIIKKTVVESVSA